MKTPLRIHAKSLSDAVAPSKKKFFQPLHPVAVRGLHIYIAGVPIVCQIFARKAGQRVFVDWNRLLHQQGIIENMWQPFLMYTFDLRSQSRLVSHHNKHTRTVKECGNVNFLWPVSVCSCWQNPHCSCLTSRKCNDSHLIVCVLLCFIKPILGNRYVRSWARGFIVSKPRETHPRSEIADVPTLPCPPLDNLGCPDPHPAP